MHSSAALQDVGNRHFGMNHARSSGHPLHVAAANLAVVAVRSSTTHPTVDHVGDGFETAVRVIGSADGFAGRILRRSHLIDEQKGVDVGEPLNGKRAMD